MSTFTEENQRAIEFAISHAGTFYFGRNRAFRHLDAWPGLGLKVPGAINRFTMRESVSKTSQQSSIMRGKIPKVWTGMNLNRLAVILVFLVLPAGSSLAQPAGPASPDRDFGWFTIGVGKATPNRLAGGITANFGSRHVFQVGLHSTGGWFSREEISAYSIAYGRSWVREWGRGALFVGPSITKLVYLPEQGIFSEWEEELTEGLVLSAQVNLAPRLIGPGLEAFAMVTLFNQSSAGLCLTLVLEGDR